MTSHKWDELREVEEKQQRRKAAEEEKQEETDTMEEKRKHKRLDLDVSIQLERIDKDGITTLRFFHVTVQDISRSGLSFVTDQNMEIGTFYDTKIQIWTKEVIDAVIEIVRQEDLPDGRNKYGCEFIGLSDTDALKIDIYQIFNEI